MATDTIINNLNSVIGTKNEIAGIIRENGINPGNTFSDYPDMLRTIISTSGGGASGDEIISYISSYLGAYNYIDQIKLSANSYISMADVSACGYVTSADVPTISENIIPKETGSYTLGSSTYKYLSTYSSNIYTTSTNKIYSTSNYNLRIDINGTNSFYYDTLTFVPGGTTKTKSLGTNTLQFLNTYTSNLYVENTYISNLTYLPVNTYWYDGSTYHWLGSLFN